MARRRTSSPAEVPCPHGCGRTFKTDRGARQHAAQAAEHRQPAGPVVDHDARWRPRDRKRRPVCGYTFRGSACSKSGPHYCAPRADRAVAFHAEVLVHTKGRFARQPFVPEPWQEHEILRPLFGEVVWSQDWDCYVRRYRLAYIVLGRKNGKSESASGLVLLLLVGDDEEAAEVYGAARDTKQAGKVGEVVDRMRQLSPALNGDRDGRLKQNKNSRRIFDERTASYFEVITADDLGELGHNPHGAYIDEVLSQRDGGLYHALRTSMGARHQPLLALLTTETNDPHGFGASEIDEAERIQEDPSRAPHVLSYVRKLPRTEDELDRLRRVFPGHPDLPVSCDPLDERNWKWPNPALDSFLSRQSLRDEALEAQNEPAKMHAFLQFRMNQRVQQATRYVPLDLWDANVGEVAASPDWLDAKLEGLVCDAGLDLSSRFDLTAWCMLFEDGWIRWRFWIPETVVPLLDDATGGHFATWVDEGWVTATDGDVIDYQRVYADIEADAERFAIRSVTYDKWCGEPVRQQVEDRTGLEMVESATTYERMTRPMTESMRKLKAGEYAHGGNPLARWMAGNLEAKHPSDDPDRIRPTKPDRGRSGSRIDGMVALFFAEEGAMAPGAQPSVYETRGLEIL